MAGAIDHTDLMANWQSGDRVAGNLLLKDLDRELRIIAYAKLAQESNSSLSTGDLINEAVIKISRLKKMQLTSKAHILAIASRIMRQVLVDHARAKKSNKRDHQKVTLVTNIAEWKLPIELMELDLLLMELKDIHPQRADIVEMRFFGGMSISDIAVVLDISEKTVQRRWASTRAWLQDRLSG
ncbi:ECF-type sigma factor [Parasphingorhabdus halotolerans]|uniref:Sigma-70 family RNA polymerase sigma factor n=1 Tax=Parasphingorhabdus halotolerans TaxID=2725558 RepID=A0A6H2DRV9_9SPHN|nr:ECF-type sigma factor [Parasphingorhabdus halotolerans]QJB70396.1 sigma-70 family RNA polymerase sigma factor [Parasphingorhabdus halotolerans]